MSNCSKLYPQKSKTTVRKTLKEINSSGIITASRHMSPVGKDGKSHLIDSVEHTIYGQWKDASKKYPKGRFHKGGHSQTAMDMLSQKGIGVQIEKTYSNGVRIGRVESHKNPKKAIGTTGQSWFPENWSDDDIIVAGTFVANSDEPIVDGIKFATYNGVRIGVYIVTDKNCIDTIFPDNSRQPWEGVWEVTDVTD